MMRTSSLAVLIFFVVALPSGWWWYEKRYQPLQTAKGAVMEKLTDPSSAQFKNVRLLGGSMVCGEVNAKNRLGGYVGFTTFSVTGGDNVTLDNDDDPIRVAKVLCDKEEAKQ